MDDHLSALGLTLLFTLLSILIVGGLMVWLFHFFKEKPTKTDDGYDHSNRMP